MARPRKVIEGNGVKEADPPDILKRIKIFQDYVQYLVIMDISDVVPFTAFSYVDSIFAKVGIVIKRQFGYLGFTWGYGEMRETRHPNAMPTKTAPVSLHIYFQEPVDEMFLVENAKKFQKIFDYIVKEWNIYAGITKEWE